MSASEIIPIHDSAAPPVATFDLYPLRFSADPRRFPDLNTVRGAFGSTLKSISEEAYRQFFTPRSDQGPSGFADWPRPFVFRTPQPGEIGLNVFAGEVELLVRVMQRMGARLSREIALLRLPLAPRTASISRIRVRFVTPAELKGSPQPDFGVLLARLRDRISTLRGLYGPGPLDLDFKAFGERASRIQMTHCELQQAGTDRVSKNTGQRHALKGFTGFAEYAGDLAEFLPYLEIGRWTGVGRQTVWGKGEIHVEEI